MSCIAVVPAYNEAVDLQYANLRQTLTGLLQCRDAGLISRIVVVDDGSKDYTTQVAKEYDVVLLRHVDNRGKADCVLTALPFVPGNKYTFLCDGDVFNLCPDKMKKIYAGLSSPQVLMSIAQYWQGSFPPMFCSADYSGIRLMRTEVLEPLYDSSHSRHAFWNSKFKGAGFGLELLLDLMVGPQRYVVADMGLNSARRGKSTSVTHIHNQRALTFMRTRV